MIEFIDPRRELNEYKGLRIKAYKGRRALLGQPGELYLFPSYLLHMVYPNDSEEERVSIAFNATLKGAEEDVEIPLGSRALS